MNDFVTPKDRRNHPRRSVIWLGTLRVGEFSFPCRVLDLSLAGARIRLSLPLKKDASVILCISRCGDLPAKVAWHQNDTLGLDFTLPPRELSLLLGESAVKTLGLDQATQRG